MIPKKIHWCWLSGDPLPKYLRKCIESWKRVMPDYEIILWDKSRFDIHSVKFVEDACAARKWAFAADYIRLHALYTEGGIYLDSDVMVYRRFDKFLHHSAFSAVVYRTEEERNVSANEYKKYSGHHLNAESFGAEKGNEWIRMCLEYYQTENVFIMKDGKVAVEIIPALLARYASKYFAFNGDIHFDRPQILRDNLVIYPEKYFSQALTGEFSLFKTHSMHLSQASWLIDFTPKKDILYSFRKLHHYCVRRYWYIARLHYIRKNIQKTIIKKFKNEK